jgi:hypothetical protein
MKTFITSNPALWIPSINMVVLLISWCKLMKLSDFLPFSAAQQFLQRADD